MPSIMRQVSVTYRSAMIYRERSLQGTGLAPCQTPYLMALYHQDGISQEQLSRDLNLHKSTVARQLVQLEQLGMIRREPSTEDRRQTLVYLTDKARSMEGRIRRILSDWSTYLLEDFTPEEREAALDLMTRIARRADAWAKEHNV